MIKFINLSLVLAPFSFRHPDLMESYHSILNEDGISGFEDFKTDHEDYSLPGDVRKIAAKPLDLTWKTVEYTNPDKELLVSDLDVLEGKQAMESEDNQVSKPFGNSYLVQWGQN